MIVLKLCDAATFAASVVPLLDTAWAHASISA